MIDITYNSDKRSPLLLPSPLFNITFTKETVKNSIYKNSPLYKKIKKLYHIPLPELVETAHGVHKKNFPDNRIQASQLLSIKTGGCPEDCSYCSQSAHYKTNLRKEKFLSKEEVLKEARKAKKAGATRFCMGAAWREIKDSPQFNEVLKMIQVVKELGMEVCCTLGMLNLKQAKQLKEAGLYAYNHNLDTSPEFYSKIITTRKYTDRLKTLEIAREAGLTLCTGGILGLGEKPKDRISFVYQLAKLHPPPESVTINTLVPIKGTPLENQPPLSSLEVARIIALCRILMPNSFIRLSAGRKRLSHGEQFLCFFSGANSIFLGKKLLTAENPSLTSDQEMLNSMGLSLLTQAPS